MFTPWELTDNDCNQYVRCNENVYQMIQSVWLDITSEDRARGVHEYCIVEIEIDLNDFDATEIEGYISSYGYTLESLEKEYGDAKNWIAAECIMEEMCISDAYVIGDAYTFDEAKKYIEARIKEE